MNPASFGEMRVDIYYFPKGLKFIFIRLLKAILCENSQLEIYDFIFRLSVLFDVDLS